MNENARFHDNLLPATDKGVVEMGSQVIGSCFSFGKQYTYACCHRKQLNDNCYRLTRRDRHHLTAKNSPIILAIFGKPWVAKQNYRYLFHAVYRTSSTPSTSLTLSTSPMPSTSSTSLASSSGWTLCFTYSPTAIYRRTSIVFLLVPLANWTAWWSGSSKKQSAICDWCWLFCALGRLTEV